MSLGKDDFVATQEQRREYISSNLQTADSWREKGNAGWEERCLSSVLMNYVAIAVQECGSLEEARDWFSAGDYPQVFARRQNVLEQLIADVDAKKLPASILGGNYPHLVFTHLTWALGEFEMGERFAAIAARSDVLELSTPFWQEYSRAVGALIDGSLYGVGDLTTEGQEQYWLAYLRLIESATNNQNTTAAVAEIDNAFAHRNADMSIDDDAHEIEGSGGHPVRWDFRRDGLLNYIQSK